MDTYRALCGAENRHLMAWNSRRQFMQKPQYIPTKPLPLRKRNMQNERVQKKKITFDPTINLGHILTFFGFLLTIGVGWTALSSRVGTLEDAIKTQTIRDAGQDRERELIIRQMTDSLHDVKGSIDYLTLKVDGLKK